MGWLQSYSTHCVPVRGQFPYEPWRVSDEARGSNPSFNAVSVVSPETYDAEGVATTAKVRAGSGLGRRAPTRQQYERTQDQCS